MKKNCKMSPPKNVNAWLDLSPAEVHQRLADLGLVLCEDDRLIVCNHCKYALQPSGQTVSKHLWEVHSLPAKDRTGLNAFVRGLKLQDPNTVAPRPDGSPPHTQLIVQDGFTCLQCRYRTTSSDLLQRHMAKEHGQRKCRNETDKDILWSVAILQSWSQNGKRDFWIVTDRGKENLPVVEQSPSRKRRFSEMRKEEMDRAARRQQSMEDGNQEDPLLLSNWMRRTSWTTTFAGTNLHLLGKLSRTTWTSDDEGEANDNRSTAVFISAVDEQNIAIVGAAIDRFLDQCEDTLRHTDHSIRCCLRSHFPGRSYKSPFELPARNSTRMRYRSLWKRMVYFCIRVHLLGQDFRNDVLRLPFSAGLQLATERLWFEVSGTMNDSSQVSGKSPSQQSDEPQIDRRPSRFGRERGQGRMSTGTAVSFQSPTVSSHVDIIEVVGGSDSELEDDELDGENEEFVPMSESESEDQSEEGYSASSPPESVSDDSHANESALRSSLCAGQKRVTGQSVTGDDEILDAVARFCVFLCTEAYRDGKSASTVLVYFAGVLGISADGTTFERPSNYTPKLSALIHVARLCLLEATLPRFDRPRLGWSARPCFGQQKALNKVREAFLCQGSAAPVGELLSLRAYGRTVSRTDGPTFRVDWSADGSSVKWDGGELSMEKFKSLGHHVIDLISHSMGTIFGAFRPDVDLAIVRDRISEHKNGYSFVYDRANGLNLKHLELSERICADPVHGLTTRDGWNDRAVRRFMKKEEKLLERIMAMMYLRGGQSPRVTEFVSLLCWNGAGSSRGLYVHDGAMLYITRHSKARKTTNQEFQVARYLPTKDSHILAMYLIYIRPLADMIHRSCFGTESDRKYLFSSPDDPGRPWQPSRLTAVLRKVSKDVAGVELGVQVYRQISIAITERHLAHISKPFNRFDDKTTGADLGVALAWQSGHRPMQRGTSYGIDAAYPDSLQPALLRVYKWASSIWHGFLDDKVTGGSSAAAEASPNGKSTFTGVRPRKRLRISDTTRQLRTPPTVERTRQMTQTVENTSRPIDPVEMVQPSSRPIVTLSNDGEFENVESLEERARIATPKSGDELSTPQTTLPSGASPSTSDTRTPEPQLASSVSANTSHPSEEETGAGAEITDIHVLRQFEYLEEFKLLVCKTHGYAIRNVKRHLEDAHRGTKHVNRKVAARLASLEARNPESAVPPTTRTVPFACLSSPVDAYLCGGIDGMCDYISISKQVVSRHWKDVHGQGAAYNTRRHQKRVKVQSFTPANNRRWFIVES